MTDEDDPTPADVKELLERYDWMFEVAADGRLYVTVGDNPPPLTQPMIWEKVWSIEQELIALVRGVPLPTVH